MGFDRTMIGGGRLLAVASAAATVACASTVHRPTTGAEIEPPTMNDVRWDADTGTLGCASQDAALTLPPDLRGNVHVLAHDLIIVVPPTPPSALLVTVSPSFLRGKRAGVLGDLAEIWKELHWQATGRDLREGDLQSNVHAARGRVAAEYTYDPPMPPKYPASDLVDIEGGPPRPVRIEYDQVRDRHWKLVYVEAGRCRIAAVDRAEVDDRPRLTRLLDELRIPPGLIPR
jgi:hypothetical protein